MKRGMRKEEIMPLRTLYIFSSLLMALTATGAETHLIQFNPIKGDTKRFNANVAIIQESQAMQGGSFRQDVEMTMSQKTIEVQQNGGCTTELRLEKMKFSVGGVAQEMELAIINKPIVMKLSSKGAVVEVTEPKGLDQTSKVVFDGLKQNFLLEKFDYPKNPVQIGESWSGELQGSMETMGKVIDQTGVKHYKLLNLVEFNGKTCFEIQITGTVVQIIEQGDGGQMTSHLNVVLLMEKATGLAVKANFETVAEGEIIGQSGAVQTKVTTKMSTTEIPEIRGN